AQDDIGNGNGHEFLRELRVKTAMVVNGGDNRRLQAGEIVGGRGGSGDLEVLSACNRMNLISYAQISSRLGGGIVLVIASIVFG
ncbi:2-hydroxycarboxylate transporter family protein, partial [Klebsiella pneumoniae]|uniref:2-hydroxycarboxylate transporter family protein n=1 Tax=Klebsiella pneumoniae TaxID=573 RepID=UPI00214C8F7F